jgi:hypothetical protein
LSKFSFSPQISLGNILAMLTMIGALWGFAQTQGASQKTLEQNTVDIQTIRDVDMKTLKEQVAAEIAAIKMAVDDQGKQAEEDRLFVRETLAEVKTDVGYLRRAQEETRRQERENRP